MHVERRKDAFPMAGKESAFSSEDLFALLILSDVRKNVRNKRYTRAILGLAPTDRQTVEFRFRSKKLILVTNDPMVMTRELHGLTLLLALRFRKRFTLSIEKEGRLVFQKSFPVHPPTSLRSNDLSVRDALRECFEDFNPETMFRTPVTVTFTA